MLMRMFAKKGVMDSRPVVATGMLFLAISIAWPRMIPLTGSLSEDAVDLVKGLLLGLSLGFLIWGLSLGGLRRRGDNK